MYVRGCIFFLAPWSPYVRVHSTCVPLLRHVHASTSTSMYVHIRDQNDNATYASTRWVPTVRHFLAYEDVADGSQQSGGESFFFARTHFLACEDVAGGSQQSGGSVFFREILWPVRWVPAVRWRNHYFPHNKEALPCCGHGPSCQPLHVQYSSDGSRSLTTLIMPRQEHQGSGRRGAREDAACPRVEEYEGSLVRCGVRLPSPQNNKVCG